jgi:hypothetical protein
MSTLSAYLFGSQIFFFNLSVHYLTENILLYSKKLSFMKKTYSARITLLTQNPIELNRDTTSIWI